MSPALTRCPDCGRHVFSGTACPFCTDSELVSRSTRKIVVAVAASAITLGSFGCAYGMPDDCRPDSGGYCPDAFHSDTATDSASETGATDSRDDG